MKTNSYNQEISFKAYNIIWSEVIYKIISKYQTEHLDLIVDNDAQQKIWENYMLFKDKCRSCYMSNPNGLLDRHKVSACMIYAIIKSDVIYDSVPKKNTGRVYDALNEDLALTTGLSLLRAFIITAIEESKMSAEQKRLNLDKFINGLKYPKPFHGNYRENFLAELHYTRIEKNYNILSLAHSLYLLETYTRYC